MVIRKVIPISPIRVIWILEETHRCTPVATTGSTLQEETLTCDTFKIRNIRKVVFENVF
jgi:hypothetical protein